jgi:hypothetical protein
MARNDWYSRQFGDRDEFAVCFALGRDAHPSGDAARDESWGSFELWVRGRCLTRSLSDAEGVRDGVRWTMLPLLQWFLDVGVRMVDEEPYPGLVPGVELRDASDWSEASLDAPTADPAAERLWFLRRSEWRNHHALRRAAEDVALPNVHFRRLGEDIEVSWDNEGWATTRADLRFVELRGTEHVPAQRFAELLLIAVTDVAQQLEAHRGLREFGLLAARCGSARATGEDWRWLIHSRTAECIRRDLPELAAELDRRSAAHVQGLYLPHTAETELLRLVELDDAAEIVALLRAAEALPATPVRPDLVRLIRPTHARGVRVWEEGNTFAEVVRESMGWGDGPLPDLEGWLREQGCGVRTTELGLPDSVSMLTIRTKDHRAVAQINPVIDTPAKGGTRLATALGHLLMDPTAAIEGRWEHWPSAARARAFGVALVLPESGIRETLAGRPNIDLEDVRRIMQRFDAGAHATTFRLRNLRLISEEERGELILALGA